MSGNKSRFSALTQAATHRTCLLHSSFDFGEVAAGEHRLSEQLHFVVIGPLAEGIQASQREEVWHTASFGEMIGVLVGCTCQLRVAAVAGLETSCSLAAVVCRALAAIEERSFVDSVAPSSLITKAPAGWQN